MLETQVFYQSFRLVVSQFGMFVITGHSPDNRMKPNSNQTIKKNPQITIQIVIIISLTRKFTIGDVFLVTSGIFAISVYTIDSVPPLLLSFIINKKSIRSFTKFKTERILQKSCDLSAYKRSGHRPLFLIPNIQIHSRHIS